MSERKRKRKRRAKDKGWVVVDGSVDGKKGG